MHGRGESATTAVNVRARATPDKVALLLGERQDWAAKPSATLENNA
jgi:hypothetical protein